MEEIRIDCAHQSAEELAVGENSVIGAGSAVTHDVEPDTIVAGNPARIIRKI